MPEPAPRQDGGPVAAEVVAARVLEGVTVADIAADARPEPVRQSVAEPAAGENP